MRPRFLPLVAVLGIFGASLHAQQTDEATARDSVARTRLPHDFGSDATFNPWALILNDGFNNLDLYTRDRRVSAQPYHRGLRNLGRSLLHLEAAYRDYGWRWALHNELLPLSGREGGQWVPNYQDHIFGSGLVSTRMIDWFARRNYEHPVLLGYLSMTASHVLNEVIERPNERSVDALSDLVVFDNLGFLLFRSTRVRNAVERHIDFENWMGQPVIAAPDGTIDNASENFVVRSKATPETHWRFIYYWGVTHLVGASRRVGENRWLSVTAGAGAGSVSVRDTVRDARTTDIRPRFGLFLDEGGSLLASLIWINSGDRLAALNVYPGALAAHRDWPGLYIGMPRRGLRVGLTTRLGVGLGVEH